MFVRAALVLALVALACAKSIEQQRLELDQDAEFVPQTPVEAIEVPANEDGDASGPAAEDEGRQFLLPRVRIFRIPFMRSPPLFPSWFQRRPIFTEDDSILGSELGGGDVDKRIDEEQTKPESSEPGMEFAGEMPPVRRPGLPSLSDIFGEFNRRMQSFEEEIANMFTSLVRQPADRTPAIPSEPESDTEPADEVDERPQSGFNLFRPFLRPFSSGSIFGFRNPSNYPTDYKNTTSKTEVINGTKVMVNETISKGGDENNSHFVHFKVIHILPESQTETETDVERVTGRGDVEVVTGKGDAEPVSHNPNEESEAVDLANILPESAQAAAATEHKTGINPADFGYELGDNEIDKTDVKVVNLSENRDVSKLPAGVEDISAKV